jgi:hypothetical protein
MALGFEWIDRSGRVCRAGDRGWVRLTGREHGPPSRPRRHAATMRRAVGVRLGRGQEPLEVTQPVAAIAAGVDPEVAQPPGVAPCPDRVRVHAEQPGGLGDRQGRIDWS